MSRFLIILVLALNSIGGGVIAQENRAKFLIRDTQGQTPYGAHIYINGLASKIVDSSVVFLECKIGDSVLIKHNEFKPLNTQVKNNHIIEGEITVKIILHRKRQQFEEITVTSEKMKSFFNEENVFIIDFLPIYSSCFIVSKEKNNFYALLLRNGSILFKKELDFKPENIFLDVLGNVHILSAESSFQVWLSEDGINFLSPCKIEKFNRELKSLVLVKDSSVIAQNYDMDGKRYSLNENSRAKQTKIYESFDRVEYLEFRKQLSKIISMYYQSVPIENNLIELGLWNGDVVQLAENSDIVTEIGWLNAVLKGTLPCASFGGEKFLTTVDFHKDSIFFFAVDSKKLLTQKKLNMGKQPNSYYDFFSDKIFLISQKRNALSFLQIDNKSQEINEISNLENILKPRVIKFSGEWVYLLYMEDSGFNKILRQKISI